MRITVTIIIAIIFSSALFAQAPQKMSYQAVIRNSSNTLVVSKSIGMQTSILQGSATGTAVYVEKQSPTTNANGLVSIEIGTGTVVSGSMNTINWANGPYFIKTETDVNGGSNYTITGTSELLSVPFALFAANSAPGPQGVQGIQGIKGDSGARGLTGLQGIQGIQGIKGDSGLNGAVNAWGLLGSSSTVDNVNFIGTTNNVPFNIKVNNQKAGRIDPTLINAFFGYRAGALNTTGSQNTANGTEALYSNTTGGGNTATGS